MLWRCRELIKAHQWVLQLHPMASFIVVSNPVKYCPGNLMEHFWQKKFIQIIHFFMWGNFVWVEKMVQSHLTVTGKLKGNGFFVFSSLGLKIGWRVNLKFHKKILERRFQDNTTGSECNGFRGQKWWETDSFRKLIGLS